jgi:hypothetical protein
MGTVPNGGAAQGQVWTAAQWGTAWQSKADDATGGTYTPPGAGAVSTTVATALGFQPVSVFNFFTTAQIADVLAGTLTQDVTIAIQAAVTACPNQMLFFPGSKYKISAQINILNGCKLQGVRGLTTIILATQNQYGFVVGNGTSGGRTAANDTTIDGFAFNPLSTVAAFASGACIYLNYVEFVNVTNCIFYGYNGTATIFWQDILIFQATECEVSHCYFYYTLSYGLYASGGGAGNLRTVDCRFDFNEFTNCGNDCIHLDANCAGCTINFMIAYSFTTWGIVINSGTSGSGSLHYICQPDIECDGTSGCIYLQSVANIDISGGWLGTGTFVGTTPSLWVGSAANSVKVTGTQLLFGRVQVDGPACNFTGCDIVGDNVAATYAMIISSTATDTSITGGTIRQHVNGGIQFSSTPPAARCKVVGVNFKNCGAAAGTGYEVVGSTGLPGSILGVSGSASNLPPVIRDCQSDVAFAYAAGATGIVVTSVGRDFMQVTASANITTIRPLSIGNRLTIQAGTGGITVTSGGNLQLKVAPTTIGAFTMMDFVTDGQNWFEVGQNF